VPEGFDPRENGDDFIIDYELAKELRDRGLHLGPKPAAGVVLGGVVTRGAAASMPAITAMKTTATPKRSTGKDKKATAFSRAT
jgi:hypothetical protein